MVYRVAAGDLRTRITLQRPSLAKDAGGAQVSDWKDAPQTPQVWARWVNAHGQESVASDALKAAQSATVTIRQRADIEVTWRVLRAGVAWNIVSMDAVQDRRQWLELRVERAQGTL